MSGLVAKATEDTQRIVIGVIFAQIKDKLGQFNLLKYQ